MSTLPDLEAALGRAAERPRFLGGTGGDTSVDPGRLAANLAAIEAEIDAPPPGRLARVLARLGVDDATIPLVTATPALRRSWIAAVTVALRGALRVPVRTKLWSVSAPPAFASRGLAAGQRSPSS